jgi:hypothetical protein
MCNNVKVEIRLRLEQIANDRWIEMMNDDDPRKESASDVAKRKWRNNELSKKYRDGKMPTMMVVDPDDVDWDEGKVKAAEKLDLTSVIENDDPRVSKFERRLKKEIREMMRGYNEENLIKYRLYLQSQRHRYLTEKLKRLEAMAAQQESEK